MKGLCRQFLPLFLVIAPLLPARTSETPASANIPATGAVPSGTTLHIRLRQTISSFGSKQDTPISAIVIQPVELDGQIVLPMNTSCTASLHACDDFGRGNIVYQGYSGIKTLWGHDA